MEAINVQGLLSKILPPCIEDAGLEDCALSPESIHDAFLKAAAAVKSRATSVEDLAYCVLNQWHSAKHVSDAGLNGVLNGADHAATSAFSTTVDDLANRVLNQWQSTKYTSSECDELLGVPSATVVLIGADHEATSVEDLTNCVRNQRQLAKDVSDELLGVPPATVVPGVLIGSDHEAETPGSCVVEKDCEEQGGDLVVIGECDADKNGQIGGRTGCVGGFPLLDDEEEIQDQEFEEEKKKERDRKRPILIEGFA